MDSDSLLFSSADHRRLEAGTYVLTVEQPVARTDGSVLAAKPFTATARVEVRGARTALQPGWVESRFPPPASVGDHAGVLPHVVLTRSTLPWERDALARPTGDSHPWLAVLVFTVDELAGAGGLPPVSESTASVGQLRPASTSPPAFPGLGTAERGLDDSDVVRVVDVPRQLLERVLPDASWLTHLAHVRQRFVGNIPASTEDRAALDRSELGADLRHQLRDRGCTVSGLAFVEVEAAAEEWRVMDPESGHRLKVEGGPPGGDLEVTEDARSVVFSCRATLPGHRYRAHLVSLEGRYRRGKAGGPGPFDYGSAASSADLVRVITLDSWDFSVDEDAGQLEAVLRGLVQPGGGAAQPSGAAPGTVPPGSMLPYRLDLVVPADGLTGPGTVLLHSGHALLGHRRRNGGVVRSWYRGPLVSAPAAPFFAPGTLPAQDADQLLGLDDVHGLLFTTYAAAWELGRQLTLTDQKAALELVRWRNARRHQAHDAATGSRLAHLRRVEDEPVGVPESVRAWFERLTLLDGVPFGYLVPDPAMLPPESIRTFVVDPSWVDCLLDGSFAAGRVLYADARDDARAWDDVRRAAFEHLGTGVEAVPVAPRPPAMPPVSGLLIRSRLISAWPKVQIDGFSPGGAERAHVLRRAPLSDNVLLILFAGPLGRLELHANPETLHLGLDVQSTATTPPTHTWGLTPRQPDGTTATVADSAPMRGDDVLDIATTRQRDDGPGEYTSAEFALRLVAGVPRLTIDLT